MNKHGFLMMDALVIVMITSALSVLCISTFSSYQKYKEAVENYYIYENERLIEIYNEVKDCEACKIGND